MKEKLYLKLRKELTGEGLADVENNQPRCRYSTIIFESTNDLLNVLESDNFEMKINCTDNDINSSCNSSKKLSDMEIHNILNSEGDKEDCSSSNKVVISHGLGFEDIDVQLHPVEDIGDLVPVEPVDLGEDPQLEIYLEPEIISEDTDNNDNQSIIDIANEIKSTNKDCDFDAGSSCDSESYCSAQSSDVTPMFTTTTENSKNCPTNNNMQIPNSINGRIDENGPTTTGLVRSHLSIIIDNDEDDSQKRDLLHAQYLNSQNNKKKINKAVEMQDIATLLQQEPVLSEIANENEISPKSLSSLATTIVETSDSSEDDDDDEPLSNRILKLQNNKINVPSLIKSKIYSVQNTKVTKGKETKELLLSAEEIFLCSLFGCRPCFVKGDIIQSTTSLAKSDDQNLSAKQELLESKKPPKNKQTETNCTEESSTEELTEVATTSVITNNNNNDALASPRKRGRPPKKRVPSHEKNPNPTIGRGRQNKTGSSSLGEEVNVLVGEGSNNGIGNLCTNQEIVPQETATATTVKKNEDNPPPVQSSMNVIIGNATVEMSNIPMDGTLSQENIKQITPSPFRKTRIKAPKSISPDRRSTGSTGQPLFRVRLFGQSPNPKIGPESEENEVENDLEMDNIESFIEKSVETIIEVTVASSSKKTPSVKELVAFECSQPEPIRSINDGVVEIQSTNSIEIVPVPDIIEMIEPPSEESSIKVCNIEALSEEAINDVELELSEPQVTLAASKEFTVLIVPETTASTDVNCYISTSTVTDDAAELSIIIEESQSSQSNNDLVVGMASNVHLLESPPVEHERTNNESVITSILNKTGPKSKTIMNIQNHISDGNSNTNSSEEFKINTYSSNDNQLNQSPTNDEHFDDDDDNLMIIDKILSAGPRIIPPPIATSSGIIQRRRTVSASSSDSDEYVPLVDPVKIDKRRHSSSSSKKSGDNNGHHKSKDRHSSSGSGCSSSWKNVVSPKTGREYTLEDYLEQMETAMDNPNPNIDYLKWLVDKTRIERRRIFQDIRFDVDDGLTQFPALKNYKVIKDEFNNLRDEDYGPVPLSMIVLERKLQEEMNNSLNLKRRPGQKRHPLWEKARKEFQICTNISKEKKQVLGMMCLCFHLAETAAAKRLFVVRKMGEKLNWKEISTPRLVIRETELFSTDAEKMWIYAEGLKHIQVPNFYQAVLTIFSLHFIFQIEYDSGLKQLFKHFESLACISKSEMNAGTKKFLKQ